MTLGFFDSGMGGLYMMEVCMEIYPKHNYIYVGDTKHLPYGSKKVREILDHMTPHLLFLLEEKQCDYLIVACNTASSQSLYLFLDAYPKYKNRIINIVNITKEYFLDSTIKNEPLFVLATERTVASRVYEHITKEVRQIPMPGLVDLIEAGDQDGALVMIREALSNYSEISTLLLGCTHYVYLISTLKRHYPDTLIIGQDIILVEYLLAKLSHNNEEQKREYYLSRNSKFYHEKYGYQFIELS